MFHSGRPNIEVERIAGAVAAASDLDSSYDQLIAGLSADRAARVCIFRFGTRGWALVAQSRGGMGVSLSDMLLVLRAVPGDRSIAAINLESTGEGIWTSMMLDVPEAPIMVLLPGDWTEVESFGALRTALSFALRSVQERHLRRRAEQILVDGYQMGRRLSRPGGLDITCQRIVQQVSRSMRADRVTLALREPDQNGMAIAAVSGRTHPPLEGVHIEPGAWVMGHVYSSRRSVVVRDVRELPGMPRKATQYRTFSFAAVPVLSGGEIIGVLAATDKRDGTAFDQHDVVALRAFSVSAALAVNAALSDAEAQRLAHAATVDALTGLFNRTYLDARLHQEFERARRGASSLTLLLADIDDFKTVNDTSGHQVGDAVLQTAAAVLRSAVRVFDVCARYGGDEFAILMPSSDQSSAAACAERIRRRIAEFGSRNEAGLILPRVTMSIGVAVIEAGDAPPDLVRRADECLYGAKAEGKNRVRVSGLPSAPVRVPFVPLNPRKS
jgi:diguanylate cyclase (GGDEF)-like protein